MCSCLLHLVEELVLRLYLHTPDLLSSGALVYGGETHTHLFFQGMCISVLGPTFEDLAVNVKQNISNISYIFVGRSGGYIAGSLLGGALIDCMNPHLLLGNSCSSVVSPEL